jgi:hypothetical protein
MSKKRKSTPQSQKDELNYEYDPVKREIGGEQAEKVIWSTNSLNAAVKALNEGLPLKNNPFIGKDAQLLKPDLLYKRTAEEIDDYVRCMTDVVYFASKCYLMTPEGLKPCVLRDYQVEYLNLLKDNRFTVFLSCRQSGKTLNIVKNVNILLNIDCYKEKLRYYKLKDNLYNVPIFEILNLVCKQTWQWKVKYKLYKLIYKLSNNETKKFNETTSGLLEKELS